MSRNILKKILKESGINNSIARNASYINASGELFNFLMKKENNFFYNSSKDIKFGLDSGEADVCILLKKKSKKYIN